MVGVGWTKLTEYGMCRVDKINNMVCVGWTKLYYNVFYIFRLFLNFFWLLLLFILFL
jgi:hypothetical protein